MFPLFRVSDYWSWLGHPYSPVQTNLCSMNKPSNYANSQQTLFWPAGGMHDCVNIDTFHIKDFFFFYFAMGFCLISLEAVTLDSNLLWIIDNMSDLVYKFVSERWIRSYQTNCGIIRIHGGWIFITDFMGSCHQWIYCTPFTYHEIKY